MAKLKDGFYKQTAEDIGSDLYVLLAGGGSKALSDFATASSLSDYVTLATAQTISGVKTFSGGNIPIRLNSTGNEVGVQFLLSGATKGWVGHTNTTGTYIYNYPSAKYIGVKDDGTPYYYSGGFKTLLHSDNYTEYTVTKTGTGASGTWGINITGNASTATDATYTSYIKCPDTRSVAYDIRKLQATLTGVSFDFKSKAVSGLSADFSGIMTYRPYETGTDWSGGPAHLLAFDLDGLHYRQYGGSGFTTWKTLAYTTDIPTVTNYYWANVPISDTSSLTTSPTFANAKTTGLLTVSTGASHYGIKVGNTYINSIDGDLIFQNNSAIRFGGDSWDYDVWAGLRYVSSAKTIHLGIADKSIFSGNNVLGGGTLNLPGIHHISSALYNIKVGSVASHTPSTTGWYTIAQVSGYFNYDIYITGEWANGMPSTVRVNICNINDTSKITQLAGYVGSLCSQIRLGRVSTNVWDVQVYIIAQPGTMGEQRCIFTGFGGLTIHHTSTLASTSYSATNTLAFGQISGISLTTDNYASYLGYIGTTAVQTSAATQALTGITRISNSANNILYLGNSDNSSWVYTLDICSHSGASKWAININGAAWFSKLMVGIAYSETGSNYAVNVSGDSYTTGWSRAASGFYVEGSGVYFTNQGYTGEIDMTENNEFLWGSSTSSLYFNYRPVTRGTTVTDYIWNAGSPSSYATHRLGSIHIHSNGSNYNESIRIYPSSEGWTALVFCGDDNTADSGTSAKTWGLFTNGGNFYINKNSSSTSTGYELCNVSGNWGIGTNAPAYTLDVTGKIRVTNRMHANEWIQFSNNTGLYWPHHPNTGIDMHIRPNIYSSYGGFAMHGKRGGYSGILLGTSNTNLCFMDDGNNSGLYVESLGKWVIYNLRSSNQIGIGTSSCTANYGITLGSSTHLKGNLLLNGESYCYTLTTDSSSNWVYLTKLLKGSTTSDKSHEAGIGWHNTGGDGNGALTLVPHAQNTNPWAGTVGLYITASTLVFNGASVWHSGNDGSGSGLDADLLDGIDSTGFFISNKGSVSVPYIDLTTYTSNHSNYKNYNSGTYTVARSEYTDTYIVFRSSGSTSSIELMSNYNDTARLKLRKTIDSNRVSGPWRELAFTSDIPAVSNSNGYVPRLVSFPSHTYFGSSTSTYDYLQNIVKWIYDNANYGDRTYLMGVGNPNSLGMMNIQLYGNSGKNSAGWPRYCSGTFLNLGESAFEIFGTNDYNYYYYRLSVDGHGHRITKLHRRDSGDDYSLQHHWTGSYWYLRGYYGDTYHAGVQVAYADSASTATEARTLCADETMKLYATYSNEVNFGGTNEAGTIYFGYRATDSKPIPTSFVFGGPTGSATLTSSGFKKKGSSDSYVLLGGGSHKLESSLSVGYAELAGSATTAGTAYGLSKSFTVFGVSFNGAVDTTVDMSTLIGVMGTGTSDITDSTHILTSHVGGFNSSGNTTTIYARTANYLWNYIKGKIDATYTHGASGGYIGTTAVQSTSQSLSITGINGVYTNYSGTSYELLLNLQNANVSVLSCGGGLYLGYTNTSGIYLGNTNSTSSHTYPLKSNTYYLGSSGLYWKEVTANVFRSYGGSSTWAAFYLNSGGNTVFENSSGAFYINSKGLVSLKAASNLVVLGSSTAAFYPNTTLTLGTSSLRWSYVYATHLNAEGGSFYTDANGAYWTSDARLKTNITKARNLDIADLLVEFDWKDSGYHSWGYIALDLLEVLPEAVSYSEDIDRYSVNYNVAHSAAIASLTARIKELEEKLKKYGIL